MANEYLKRTPTSTGNRRVWTWAGWVKTNIDNNSTNGNAIFICAAQNSGNLYYRTRIGRYVVNNNDFGFNHYDGADGNYGTQALKRDHSNWEHYMCSVDTTQEQTTDRVKIYLNGVYQSDLTTVVAINRNLDTYMNGTSIHFVGADGWTSTPNSYSKLSMTDVFFIDGQALTPDVFGFYKVGKGYVSAGSTQSTDFRPGQWVPKTPRVIKTAINNNGGFGVNGFYLPMNDSNNFGADFHCEPNSIIKLQENLPQPRCRIDGVGDYTGALRDDPFKQYLVLALPFVSGGLQSGFGDYSAAIKGSGSAKTVTSVSVSGTGPSINNNSVYYGSSCFFDGGRCLQVPAGVDFAYGTKPFTVEGWVNPTGGTDQYGYAAAFLYQQSQSGQNYFGVYVGGFANSVTAPEFVFIMGSGGGGGGGGAVVSAPNKLPMNAWSHFAVTKDTENVVKLFLNGVVVGIATNVTYDLNDTSMIPTIGRYTHGGANGGMYNGYIQDLRIYKGVAKYKGGFDVPRPYTPVGIATWRAVPDSPANNFATWNPLDRARNTGTQTDGNLSTATNTGNYAIRSTVGVSTGKWYWEFCPTAVSITNHHGIVAVGRSMGAFYLGETLDSWGVYDSNGNKRNNGSFDSYGTGFSQYDVGMVALDKSNGKIWWGKNGTWFASGNPAANTNEAFSNINIVCSGIGTDSFVSPSQLQYNSCSYNFGQNPTFSGNTTAGTYTDSNNKGLFKYQPPSGFLALCEDNLPTPAISDPGKYFKTVLYTGDGNSGRSIVGVGFQPDFVWIKARTIAYNHRVFDSVRGAGKDNFLLPNSTAVEGDSGNYYGGISSFDADGFSMVYGTGGSNIGINASGENYVAWCWKAGAGTTSTNTNGSITSVVSVNQDAGFSIVSWTGNGSSTATVGHGLGKVPAFLISKARGGTNDWWVVHKSGNGNLQLNTTNALITSGGANGSMGFPSTLTSSTFTFTNGASSVNNTNQSGVTYISYCWAEIEGYSKFGSYTGNGSTDGPFVYCGFKPAWVMIKRTDSTGDWYLFDSSRNSSNPVSLGLISNTTQIDGDYTGWGDFLSNGFKIRRTDGAWNASGGTYIFVAFAESPFQTANAK